MKRQGSSGKSHVAGHIRGKKPLKDGNLRFRIINQVFLVRQDSGFARVINSSKEGRAAVFFRTINNKKYPVVLEVLADPSGTEVLEYSQKT